MKKIYDDDSSSEEYDDENIDVTHESDETDESDEIEENNDLILDESEDSDQSEEVDTETLKTTMFFPNKGKNTNKTPEIIRMPQLKSIVLPKQKSAIELPKKNVKVYSNKEIETILENMPGINVLTNPINYDRENIYELLQQESQESLKDFNVRKEITLKINNIKEPKMKNSTSVVLGSMITKKLRFGIKYDDTVEILIKDILEILKNQ